MVFNLKPPDITLDFERRKYRLGDTINATLTLIPNGNIRVRKASLNLVALVRRTKVKMGRAVGMTMGLEDSATVIEATDYLPMQQHTDQKISMEVFHGTTILLSKSLRKGEVSRHNAAFSLDPQLRKLQELAMETEELQRDANRGLSIEPWWLEARVDVIMGRDAILRRQIEIIAPLKASA